jgi:hypothetical protein
MTVMDDILTPMEKMDNAIKRANARAEAAEAENARLREQVAALRAAVTRSRMMMDFNEFVGALRSAGWYSKADAQHRHIRVVWETLIARAEAAEAEVGRLQAAPDQWKQCGDAIMLCATGRAAPLSDSDVCGEIVRLRERNKELEMWFSVALDLLSDFLETLN